MRNKFFLIGIIALGLLSTSFVFAQTDASVTPFTPGWGGPNYDQPLWTISSDKAIIPVSFTSYHCTSAALVLEYATWADYTKIDWQTGASGKYTGFIPASASDLSKKVTITIPNLSPSTSYIFRVGAKCTSSSPMGTLAYTTSANQFSTPATPLSPTPPGDVTPPNAPDNLQVKDITSTHVALSWNTPADDVAVIRYELKYKIGSNTFLQSDWAGAPSLPAPGAPPPGIMGVATFGYNELIPNTTYILGLKAYDAAGNASALAVSPSFTTLAPPTPSIPVAPIVEIPVVASTPASTPTLAPTPIPTPTPSPTSPPLASPVEPVAENPIHTAPPTSVPATQNSASPAASSATPMNAAPRTVVTPVPPMAIPSAVIPSPSSPSAVSSLSGFKCKNFLNTTKSTLDTYDRYIKNIKQKMKGAPKNYVNRDVITTSLSDADEALTDTRNLLKKKECSESTLGAIREKKADANTALQDVNFYLHVRK